MASKAAQPNSIPALKKLVRASMAKTLQGLATAHIEDASRAALKKLLSLPQVQKAQHVAAFASMEKEVQTNSMVFTLLSRGKHVLLPRVLGRRSMAFREVSLAHTADDSSAVASGSSAQMAASPASSAPQLSDVTEGNNISAAKLAELLGLETSKWGIREPVLPAPSGTSVDVDTVCEARGAATAPLDVVLVPCVAFGREGARLGHGGGFYDTFFGSVEQLYSERGWQQPWLIGFCLDEQLLAEADVPVASWDRHVDVVVTPSDVLCTSQRAKAMYTEPTQ